MSRSAEEQQLLEQKIQAMKQKNEELRRRHLEVEADKQSAAKQNALVKMNVPLDDDWVPGRHIDNPRNDRQHSDGPLSSHERVDDQGQRYEQRRYRNDGQRDDINSHSQRHFQNSSIRKSDQSLRQRPDGDRFYGNENRRSGEYSGRNHDGSGSRSREWSQHASRGGGNHQPSFSSKVFKNSSMESDRSKRPGYRLAEGDGPPPDPSYSFLGDSMRDSPESVERRGQPNRRGFHRGRGRGGQTWNNRNSNDFRRDGFEDGRDVHSSNFEGNKRQSDDAWRRERHLIDQERINRQKTSDGNWSREWDNHKVLQDGDDRPNRWRKGSQAPNYDRGHQRRGFQDDSGHSPKHNFFPRNSTTGNVSGHESTGKVDHDESSGNKLIRRGRFSNQNRYKDNIRFKKESSELPPSNSSAEISKDIEGAKLIETNVKSVEKLQVSVVVDPTGSQKRCVEGLGENVLVNMRQDAETSDFCKNIEQKRPRKTPRKAKRNRVLSTTSTGTTTGTGEEDGSWEDLSSDEENVSILTELQRTPHHDLGTTKSTDVSSGPESLDPIPPTGKEDEFLWDDFHPAGFQDNAMLDLNAEAAYQALLNEHAKQEVIGDTSSDSHKVSFRLDTSCLEDSSDELEGAKLDPLLVTTQIVQAEVDCMSLTSIPTDTSLPEDLSQVVKSTSLKEENIPEENASIVISHDCQEKSVTAEELSGPVSILDVPSSIKEVSQDSIKDSPVPVKLEDCNKVESGSPTTVKTNEMIVQTEMMSDLNITSNVELDTMDSNDQVNAPSSSEETKAATVANLHEKTCNSSKDICGAEEGIQTTLPSQKTGSEIKEPTSTKDNLSHSEINHGQGKDTDVSSLVIHESYPLNAELSSERESTTGGTSGNVTTEKPADADQGNCAVKVTQN
ncbi:Coiled-coil domain-containing protein 9 [Frankliniella fusca]|uniref:Coiled-coil domain-containing protein 9 n=1 Tax=Frankliniella fusca TaxID=407009 RepID=A0AAE1GU48_9NEOP|nr:Coiled-coil domain-containing protein 9 [Frankliniella fusca]